MRTPEAGFRRYLFVLAGFLVLATIASLSQRLTIAGCAGYGYGPGLYMAQCSNKTYGDYEHAALALDFEPVRAAIGRAKVFFFGYSRTYFAFSGKETEGFLTARGLPFYDLALSSEYSAFPKQYLLPMVRQARIAVIDVDPFFRPDTVMAVPGRLIETNRVQAFMEYSVKRAWQAVHRQACTTTESWGSLLCGTSVAAFRRIDNGNVVFDFGQIYGKTRPRIPVQISSELNKEELAEDLPYAEAFLDRLPVPRRCVIFTEVPSSFTFPRRAEAMARALGVPFVEPEVPGLTTVDKSHLDEDSAAAWSTAFWVKAAPIVDACAKDPAAP